MATKDSIKKLIRQQETPPVVVSPGSKAALFLNPNKVKNANPSVVIPKVRDEDGVGDSEETPDPGGEVDVVSLDSIEIVYPPKKIYINGQLHWEYEIYIKNTSKFPDTVEWVDIQKEKKTEVGNA
jgi:hypothetical protein